MKPQARSIEAGGSERAGVTGPTLSILPGVRPALQPPYVRGPESGAPPNEGTMGPIQGHWSRRKSPIPRHHSGQEHQSASGRGSKRPRKTRDPSDVPSPPPPPGVGRAGPLGEPRRTGFSRSVTAGANIPPKDETAPFQRAGQKLLQGDVPGIYFHFFAF